MVNARPKFHPSTSDQKWRNLVERRYWAHVGGTHFVCSCAAYSYLGPWGPKRPILWWTQTLRDFLMMPKAMFTFIHPPPASVGNVIWSFLYRPLASRWPAIQKKRLDSGTQRRGGKKKYSEKRINEVRGRAGPSRESLQMLCIKCAINTFDPLWIYLERPPPPTHTALTSFPMRPGKYLAFMEIIFGEALISINF